MDKLNYEFKDGKILYASELNTIVNKIDEVIDLLSTVDSNSSSITDAQIEAKINDAKKEYNKLLLNSIKKLQQAINDLENVPEGDSQVITKEEWSLYRKKTSDLEEQVAAITLTYQGIDLTSLKEDVDKINKWSSQLTIDPTKISVLVSLLDSNNQLKINPASIIAAITDEDGKLTSEISISADRIDLSGYVTSDTLEANYIKVNLLGDIENSVKNAVIDNIQIPDTATIKNAVIEELNVPGTLTGQTINGVNINGGSINIGNGNFTVNSNGDVIANSIQLAGKGHFLFVEPGGIYTLPEAKAGSSVCIINKYPTRQPSQAADIIIKTTSYDNFNTQNYASNSFIRLFYSNSNSWDSSIVRSACIYGSSGDDANILVSSLLVSDGKDWYEVSSTLAI